MRMRTQFILLLHPKILWKNNNRITNKNNNANNNQKKKSSKKLIQLYFRTSNVPLFVIYITFSPFFFMKNILNYYVTILLKMGFFSNPFYFPWNVSFFNILLQHIFLSFPFVSSIPLPFRYNIKCFHELTFFLCSSTKIILWEILLKFYSTHGEYH